MNLNEVMASGTVTIPLILAVTQGFRLMTADKWHKWTPLIAILVGCLFAWLFNVGDYVDLKWILGVGVVSGLSASGLFSGIKHMTVGSDDRSNEIDPV